MIFFGENSLRNATNEFLVHDHHERNHQGIGNRIIEPNRDSSIGGKIERRERLGGMLNYYYRTAA